MHIVPKRLVVIEAEPNGPARGAWFDPAAREAISKALSGSAAVAFEVGREKLNQVDADFPRGRLAAAGKPGLPVIKRSTFERFLLLSKPPHVAPPLPPPRAKVMAAGGPPLAGDGVVRLGHGRGRRKPAPPPDRASLDQPPTSSAAQSRARR